MTLVEIVQVAWHIQTDKVCCNCPEGSEQQHNLIHNMIFGFRGNN